MSDVFISYKRENLAAVGRLVEALRAEGVSVWWDRDIAPNAPWEATIENALAAAKLVIVAWSPASVASDNVKAEARWARGQSRLLQVFVEACEPPLFFGERQGVDLTDTVGRTREALESVRRAYELDPLYPPAVSLLAGFLLRAGAYEDGQRLYAEGRRRWPGDPSLYVPPLAWAAHAQDWDRYNSIVEAGTAVGANVYPAWLALIDFAAASRGHYPKYAQELLTRLEAQVQDSGAPALDAITSAFKLGKQEQVFDILERASYASMFEEGGANPTGHYIPGMIFDRSIRGLMIDSRFPRLCAKLGLVDYWTKSGRWPDCAEAGVLPYNFRAECQKLAG